MCRILITQAREKGYGEYVAVGLQQRTSGLVVKTTCYVIYHCGSVLRKSFCDLKCVEY